jgi:hypothetical protein
VEHKQNVRAAYRDKMSESCQQKQDEEAHMKVAVEMLRLAGVLDEVDDDIAELSIKIMPKGKDKLISVSDVMVGVQGIKNKLNNKWRDKIRKLKEKCDLRIEELEELRANNIASAEAKGELNINKSKFYAIAEVITGRINEVFCFKDKLEDDYGGGQNE